MWRYVGELAAAVRARASQEIADVRAWRAEWNGYRQSALERPELLGCLSNEEIDRLEAGPKTRPKRGRQS